MDEIDIIIPDDFHHHFRDGEFLKDVVKHVSNRFGRAIAMPNTIPPIRTTHDAISYKKRICKELPKDIDFDILMTIYLTDHTNPEELYKAKKSGIVYGCKLYPAGATTNSDFGVTNISNIDKCLKIMSKINLPLLVHGEVTDKNIDIFDREKVFIERILKPIIKKHPKLKIVMEHITTKDAVDFVKMNGPNIAATITAHHLLYNRNELFKGGICPHYYCLPILKRELHRKALLEAATSGSEKFFLGTDSAPHTVSSKESACGCAGIFTGHAGIELYAEAFDSIGKLNMLEGFSSKFGSKFYGINVNTRKIKLKKEKWLVPELYKFGDSYVRPLKAGENIKWKIITKK